MANTSRVFSNTIYLYIKMVLSIAVNIFTTSILLRALGETDYGIYSVVGGAISMMGFISGSMSGMVQRYLNVTEGTGDFDKTKKIFSNAVIIHNGLAIVAFFLFALFGVFFFLCMLNVPPERYISAVVVYICLVISTVFSITIAPYDGILNAHENMKVYSVIGIIDVLLRFLIALCILMTDTDKLVLFAILMAIEAWSVRYITKIYCIKKYEETRIASFYALYDKKLVKEMIGFAGWNLLNISTSMITLYSMNIIINHFYGTTYNAAMGIATQLTGVLMAFSLNMQKALTPVMMKSEGARDRESVLQLTCKGTKMAYLIFAFWGIPIFFFIEYILSVWLHQVPYYTDVYCRLLILSILIEQYFVFLNQTIQAEGTVKEYNIWKAIINILPIPLSILLCSHGADSSWVIINRIIFFVVIGGIINVFFCRLNLGLSTCFFVKTAIIPTIFPTIVIALFGFFLNTMNIVPKLLLFVLMLLFSAVSFYIFTLTREEKVKLHSFLRK